MKKYLVCLLFFWSISLWATEDCSNQYPADKNLLAGAATSVTYKANRDPDLAAMCRSGCQTYYNTQCLRNLGSGLNKCCKTALRSCEARCVFP